MKKRTLLFLFLLYACSLNAQIILTATLFDTLVCKLYSCPLEPDIVNSRPVLNFASLENKKNSIYLSSTPLVSMEDITEDIMIYVNDVSFFFVKVRNVDLDSCLVKKLIRFKDIKFDQALDSIKFRKRSYPGVYTLRSPLVVYQIKQRLFCKNSYVITSQSYIPYLSAPEIFIPLKKVSDGYLFTEIEDWYYDGFPKIGRLNKKYYEDMKPIKKTILRMKKR